MILNVLGTNAAGKSSVLRAMAQMDPTAVTVGRLTALPQLGVVLIGDYLTVGNKTPGADRISPNTALLDVLGAAQTAGAAAGYWAIAWEGIIIQTRTWHPAYLARGLHPAYLALEVALPLAFQRLYERSGKRPEDLSGGGSIVRARARTVELLTAWLRSQGAFVVRTDGTDPPEVLAKQGLFLAHSLYYPWAV